jgi:hypothetical protein
MSHWQPGADPLVGLTDEARLAEAIAERSEQRELTERASELATLAGTLRDLAERTAGIGLTTRSGRTFHGSALAVAVDHVAVGTPAGQHVFVRLDRVAVVRPDQASRAPVAQGERAPAQDLLLLERCARWVADRPALAVAVDGVDDLLRGRLLAVADDVLSLALDGTRTPTYVAGAAVEAIAVAHIGTT